MNDPKNFVVVKNDEQPRVKDMIYGGSKPLPPTVIWGNLYRLRRGYPMPRAGKLVFATPQFKTLTLYAPTSAVQQIPGNPLSPVSIAYPRKTR